MLTEQVTMGIRKHKYGYKWRTQLYNKQTSNNLTPMLTHHRTDYDDDDDDNDTLMLKTIKK